MTLVHSRDGRRLGTHVGACVVTGSTDTEDHRVSRSDIPVALFALLVFVTVVVGVPVSW